MVSFWLTCILAYFGSDTFFVSWSRGNQESEQRSGVMLHLHSREVKGLLVQRENLQSWVGKRFRSRRFPILADNTHRDDKFLSVSIFSLPHCNTADTQAINVSFLSS